MDIATRRLHRNPKRLKLVLHGFPGPVRKTNLGGKSARERAEALRPKLDEARESAAALEKETDAHAWFGELLGAEEDDAPAPTGSWMPTLLALRAFVEKNTESHARTEALTLLSLTNDRGAYERFCATGGAEVVVANLHELRSPSPSTRALQVKLARLLGGETPSMRARLARGGGQLQPQEKVRPLRLGPVVVRHQQRGRVLMTSRAQLLQEPGAAREAARRLLGHLSRALHDEDVAAVLAAGGLEHARVRRRLRLGVVLRQVLEQPKLLRVSVQVPLVADA